MNETATVKTTCPYCGVGCGVLASALPDGTVEIKGDPEHPANFGRLCSKGAALGETVGLDGRLLYPEIGGERVGWNAALDHVAGRFREVIDQHGPDAVAFYVSGQLLTEEYYLANKLMKGFIGSGNIDTNSRLCMSSSVAGYKRAFGEDVVPCAYEDLERADLIVFAGSNAAWCHPVLFQRILAAKKARPELKLVCIDPRRTATAQQCDLHLAIQPGADVWLFNGLLDHLRRHDKLDYTFLERHAEGWAAALDAARASAPSIPAVAAACGLAEADVATFYQWFARTEKAVTAWSQGVNQSSTGTDKVNAIVNVHLATGRIGKPGMGPFSFTGQPNAMGGREVGGLANQLAAHLDIENPEHRQWVGKFWKASNVATKPGLKAVELFEAVGRGEIKALWVMATNPAVSLPDVNAVRRALQACEFLVVSECEARTDLQPCAHVRLPALGWGEKDGTVTNSERRISRQRAFLPAPGDAKQDAWIIGEVARRLGFAAAFPDAAPWEVFCEHARLSGFRNGGERVFDISALGELTAEDYDALLPAQWPLPQGKPEGAPLRFADGDFPAGKARLLALVPEAPRHAVDAEYPLVLNTGRIRDQWHTMTRTARSARLNRHLPEPFLEIHPKDAVRHGVRDGELARLQSRWGEAQARVRVSADQRVGSVFLPMHWNDRFARRALANALVNPVTDPVSGEPESKHTPLRVEPWRPAWYGFLLARRELDVAEAAYCSRRRDESLWLHELAGEAAPQDWRVWLRALAAGEGGEWLDYLDTAAGRYRAALLRDGRLELCLFVSPTAELPPREWLAGLFVHASLTQRDRASLLAGKPASAGDDPGKTVCACFNVGENALRRAIAAQGLTTVEQIGACLKAGSNCGSCVPELKRLLGAAVAG